MRDQAYRSGCTIPALAQMPDWLDWHQVARDILVNAVRPCYVLEAFDLWADGAITRPTMARTLASLIRANGTDEAIP